MRIFLFSFILLSFFSCGDTEQTGNCIQNSITPINKDLGLPEFNALLVPGGHAEIVGGVNGIVLYNRGTSGGQFSSYVAIDRVSGNAVKLVDRMEFSFNNFSAIKAWDK